jgi:hypothetical protein
MICRAAIFTLIFPITSSVLAQEAAAPPPPVAPPASVATSTPTPATATTLRKRGWLSRVMHPFSSSETLPRYKDPKLRGLVVELQLAPQPVKLSEVRQIEVKLMVTNRGKYPVALDFPTDQRIEIQLLNSADVVLAKWSDTHAINEKSGAVLINPDEHVEYKETIATRELTPNKVFIADVFLPKYPELRVRQKFLTEP